MSNQAFTLIEVLIVLSIKLLIILLIIPIGYSQVKKTEVNVFFDELKSDVEHVQSKNYKTNDFYELTFNKTSYKIIKNSTNQLIKNRDYPTDLTVETRVFKSIVFQKNGTFKTPGRVIFIEGEKIRHELIFPFGKGGFYIVSS